MEQLTPDAFARRMADQAAEDARTNFEEFYHSWSRKCESPIEEMMAAALCYAFNSPNDDEYHFSNQNYDWPDDPCPYNGLHFYSQATIGDYRVDFLIRAVSHESVKFIVIECDGHEYHERTKDQARRDRVRDRWMAAQGITVLRFTGSEIYRDALGCMDSLEDVISQVMGWGRHRTTSTVPWVEA